jgi:hypothetical protein
MRKDGGAKASSNEEIVSRASSTLRRVGLPKLAICNKKGYEVAIGCALHVIRTTQKSLSVFGALIRDLGLPFDR